MGIGSVLRLGLATVSLVAVMSGATAQERAPVTDAAGLRIVSWDLGDAIAAGAITTPETRTAAEPAWRHTFGAERSIAETGRTFDVGRLKADVVLLQGVTSLREARRLFPARDWKLILARGHLSPDDNLVGDEGQSPKTRRSAIAVAVRYQRNLRATIVEHPLETKFSTTGPSRPAKPAAPASQVAARAPSNSQDAEQGDAIAVRLSFQGTLIWVVSASLPSDCHGDCTSAHGIQSFMTRQQGLPVILGGKLVRAVIGKPLASCNDQSLWAAADVAPVLAAKASSDTPAGCVVFVDM